MEQSQIADSTVTDRGMTQIYARAHKEAKVTKCPQEFRVYSLFDEAMEDEDISLPLVIAKDNPKWSAMIDGAKMESWSRQDRKMKRGGGIALIPSRQSSRFG